MSKNVLAHVCFGAKGIILIISVGAGVFFGGRRKLSSPDHVSAIGINPGIMAIFYPIFPFLLFLVH